MAVERGETVVLSGEIQGENPLDAVRVNHDLAMAALMELGVDHPRFKSARAGLVEAAAKLIGWRVSYTGAYEAIVPDVQRPNVRHRTYKPVVDQDATIRSVVVPVGTLDPELSLELHGAEDEMGHTSVYKARGLRLIDGPEVADAA